MTTPVEVSTENPTGTIRAGTDALRLGCNWTVEYYNLWEYFKGYIDEARISDVDRIQSPVLRANLLWMITLKLSGISMKIPGQSRRTPPRMTMIYLCKMERPGILQGEQHSQFS